VKNDAVANHDAARRQLQQRLAELLERVRKIEGDLRSAHDRDWPERATELQNDEVLEGLDEMGIAEARSIGAALNRIDQGRYGLCVSCGGAIGAKRLAAIPTAITCLSCAVPERPGDSRV
jgi:DnaK suppressor protein